MKRAWLLTAVSLTLLTTAAPAESAEPDPGKEVRAVFAAKCTGCHGSDLPKPKGRFGYVLDLKRVASNPEMVIPGKPDESELWVLVCRGEMPPADSPRGPLSAGEKRTIHDWIAAGAPEAAVEKPEVPPVMASESMSTPPAARSPAVRLLGWLGKFHLLLLHFPIALVIAAGFAEVRSFWRGKGEPSEVVRYCLWLAALAAVPTATLGWLFAAAGHGAASPQLLLAHRWLGTSTAVFLVITALCVEYDTRNGSRSRRVRILLAAGVLMTAITAHFGGLLAHGEEFFRF
jgi:uncharacterized membrane protein